MARLLQTQRSLGSDPNGPCEHGLSLHLSPERRAWLGHPVTLTEWGPEADTHKRSFLELSPNLPSSLWVPWRWGQPPFPVFGRGSWRLRKVAQQPCAGDRVTSSSAGTHLTCRAASFPGVTLPMQLTASCRQPEHAWLTYLGTGDGHTPQHRWRGERPRGLLAGSPHLMPASAHLGTAALGSRSQMCPHHGEPERPGAGGAPDQAPSDLPELTLTPGELQESGSSW